MIVRIIKNVLSEEIKGEGEDLPGGKDQNLDFIDELIQFTNTEIEPREDLSDLIPTETPPEVGEEVVVEEEIVAEVEKEEEVVEEVKEEEIKEEVKEEEVKEEEVVEEEEVVVEEERDYVKEAAEAREVAREQLEKTFAISDEDATLVMSQPEKVLPRLMSNAAIMMFDMVQQNIQAELPKLVTQINQHQSGEAEAREAFFGVHPSLKSVKDIDSKIIEAAGVVRKLQPNLKTDQMIQRTGDVIKSMLDIKEAKAPSEKKPKAPKPLKPHTPGNVSSIRNPPAETAKPSADQELINDLIDLGY